MPESPASAAERPEGYYLAFDFGLKRIGVAGGHSRLGEATPLATIANHSGTPDWPGIQVLLDKHQPVALVVGWPLDPDGNFQAITYHVKGFVRALGRRTSLQVYLVDERYSSLSAEQALRERHHRDSTRRGSATIGSEIDKMAAAEILSRWFDPTGWQTESSNCPTRHPQ